MPRLNEQKSGLGDLLETLLDCHNDPSQFAMVRRAALLAYIQTVEADRRHLAETYQSSIDQSIAVAGSPSRATQQLLSDLQDCVAALQHYALQLKMNDLMRDP